MVLPLTAGLFVLEVTTTMAPIWHQVAEVGIVLFAFACVELWLSASTLAIIRQEGESQRRTVRPERTRLYIVPRPVEPLARCVSPEPENASGKVGARLTARAPVAWLRSFACHLSMHLW
jgi:hypothetical protein